MARSKTNTLNRTKHNKTSLFLFAVSILFTILFIKMMSPRNTYQYPQHTHPTDVLNKMLCYVCMEFKERWNTVSVEDARAIRTTTAMVAGNAYRTYCRYILYDSSEFDLPWPSILMNKIMNRLFSGCIDPLYV